ncbi:hypothetical protein Slin14017_G108780 [Septoria linicola]|nr:hypothetical protein Slin14017_G108780 [Septoria linicola]
MAEAEQKISRDANATINAQTPQDLKELLENLTGDVGTKFLIVLHLYSPLLEEGWEIIETKDWQEKAGRGRKVIDPMYALWATAICEVALPPLFSIRTPDLQLEFVFDILRPSHMASFFPAEFEYRGLHRITTLLKHKFKSVGTLSATLQNAPCWCKLAEAEKHIALPKNQSHPVTRESHGHDGIQWIKGPLAGSGTPQFRIWRQPATIRREAED